MAANERRHQTMHPDSEQFDRPLRAKLRELGLLSREQEAGLPQFLLLATEHDGARQVARLLQHQPGCSLPNELETRFFSSHHESHDLDWYIRALGGDVHLVRGEWTPSYVLLPRKTIRLIHELLPQLKLVFLLRDPAIEAWHAWQEAQQHGTLSETGSGTWPWARADLLGQLRRWKSVFPADQFFIGFDSQFHCQQQIFLNGLCEFLGVEPAPVGPRNVLQTDPPAQPPVLEIALLREACRWRIEELVACLHDEFGRSAPAHWTATSAEMLDSDQVAQLTKTFSAVVKREFDDVSLYRAVHSDEAHTQPQVHPPTASLLPASDTDSESAMFTPHRIPLHGDSLPQLVREGYRGFNVVAFRHEFMALPQAAGNVDLPGLSQATFDAKVQAREFFPGRSIADALRMIDEFLDASERSECRVSASHGASAFAETSVADQNPSPASKAPGADAA